MKLIYSLIVAILIFTSFAFAHGPAQVKRKLQFMPPADALHLFKLISLFSRPPIALLKIFVKGSYYVHDSEPTRRAFDIRLSNTNQHR